MIFDILKSLILNNISKMSSVIKETFKKFSLEKNQQLQFSLKKPMDKTHEI